MASVRLPEIRERALKCLELIAAGAEDEVAFDDAVEDADHLFEPSFGEEPGGILCSEAEVLLAAEVWQALRRAPFPCRPTDRARHPSWAEVTIACEALLAEVRESSA